MQPMLVGGDGGGVDGSAGLPGLDGNGPAVLSRAECFALLGGAVLGRVGITLGALPVILPVNFRLIGDRILFRTDVGTKLDAATRDAVVAFEVDEIEPVSHTGWSVGVIGVTSEVTDPAALDELTKADIPRWAVAGGDRVVELSTEMVSGRRIGSPPGSAP